MKRIKCLFITVILLIIQMSVAQNGTLDTTFNGNGKVVTTFGDYDSTVHSIAVQNDGKIITGGTVFNHEFSQIGLARYNNDGSLDSKFGAGGKVVSSFLDVKMSLNSIVLQSNGKIIGAGIIYNNYTDSQFFLIRYNSNGTLDKKFGVNGIIIKNSINVNSLTIQSDDQIIASGFSFDETNRDFKLMRFDRNGKLDTTFGVKGIATASIGDRDLGYDVALQSNGKIILSGTVHNTSGAYNSDIVIMRFNKNGKLDTTFGINGKTLIDNNDIDEVRSIKIQSDDKILFTGWSSFPYNFMIERLLPNGHVDADFGIQGKVATNITFNESLEGIEIQADGKIIIAGSYENSGEPKIALARYDSLGNLDSNFGENGYAITPISTVSQANSLKLQADGRIIVGGEAGTTGGTYSPDFVVLRFDSGLILNTDCNNFQRNAELATTEFNVQKNTYLAYPNPVNQYVNLSFSINQIEKLSIDLYDSNGRIIKNLLKNQSFQTGLNNLKLDLPEALTRGIYFLQISNGASNSTLKIVK